MLYVKIVERWVTVQKMFGTGAVFSLGYVLVGGRGGVYVLELKLL